MKTTIGRWRSPHPAKDAQDWVDQAMASQYTRESSTGSFWVGKSREELAEEVRRQQNRLRNSRFGMHVNAVINT